jgi:coenzyme F420-0:L-glutamate ligase/coenzyme F420-1:gamma-L-glutamate ligase
LSEIRILPLSSLPEVKPGDDLGALIIAALAAAGLKCEASDIFVVTQKIVSKAEGRVVRLETVEPSARAKEWAERYGKDARVVEVILQQAKRIVRMERGVLIVETKHGFVCANAGVDASNVPEGVVTLLPEDPDESARGLRDQLEKAFRVPLAVILSDTFGRPWREGVTNVALGVAGLEPLLDYRGTPDTHGRTLQMTVVAVADELAAAAELVMGKTTRVPVALIRGYRYSPGAGSGGDLLRRPENDLFR